MLPLIINISRISPLIAAIANLLLGVTVLFHNRKSKKNIIFFIFSMALFFWAFCCFVQSTTTNEATALLWDKLMYSIAVYVPVLILLVTNTFIKRNFKLILMLGSLFATVFLFLNWFGFFRNGMSYNFGARFVTIASYGWYAYLIFFGSFFLFACYQLFLKYRSSSAEEKNSFAYLLLAMFILLIAGNSYFALIIKKFNPLTDSLLNLGSSFLLAVYGAVMSYIIIKHHIMDMSLVIKKNTARIITPLIILSTFWLDFYLFNDNIYLLSVIGAILGCFWSFTAIPFSNFLITTARRSFVRGWYDADKLLSQITELAQQAFKASKIFEILEEQLFKELELEKSLVILAQKQNNKILSYTLKETNYEFNSNTKLSSKTVINEKELTLDHPLIKYFQNVISPKEFKDLNLEIQNEIKALGFSKATVILPFHSPGILEGLIILGERSNQVPFKIADLNFFKLLINNINSSLYRLTPYEKIEEEFKKALELASITKTVVTLHHEINSPLAAILNSANLLSQPNLPKDQVSRLSQIIKEQTQKVSIVLNKLKNIINPVTIYYDKNAKIEMLDIQDN